MPETLRHLAALFACFCGMGWFALALPPHWQQVRGGPAQPATTIHALRVRGALALLLSLLICLWVDHASMAALVWVMSLGVSTVVVALALAWRPTWLAWLVMWVNV